jgi:hypothetical protein
MKRIMAIAASVLLFAVTAYAANVHLKPPNSEPSFRDLGLALRTSATLAGLGNQDVLIVVTADADVTSTCTNQGGNAAPGQNPAPITVIGSESVPASEIKNGNLSFTVDTTEPEATIEGAPDCANSNWTETIDDLAFTSATIQVYQPAVVSDANLVLTLQCTFEPATDDGRVDAGTVDCQEI